MRKTIIGVDEVGRGPIAGHVTVCACSIDASLYKNIKRQWVDLRDSKKLTEKKREFWYKEATRLEKEGILKFSVVSASNRYIDTHGISKSISFCIEKCLEKISADPKHSTILLDGALKAPKKYRHQKTIVKGDEKEKVISLASVIAKVSRDHLMSRLHKKHPEYEWVSNKGYGTKKHYRALKKWGMTPLHRKSFLTKLKP